MTPLALLLLLAAAGAAALVVDGLRTVTPAADDAVMPRPSERPADAS
jgi:hypothetical protein